MTNIMENQIAHYEERRPDHEARMFDALNMNPSPEWIRKDNYSKTEYIPISILEMNLDAIFGPLNWKTSDFKLISLGANPNKPEQIYVAATITLSVMNENYGSPVWVTREGAASGYCSHGVIATFAAKMKAEAFKNAVKTIGKVFGRDLNRKHVEDISADMLGSTYLNDFNAAMSRQQLIAVWQSIPKDLQPGFTEAFKEAAARIEKATTQKAAKNGKRNS